MNCFHDNKPYMKGKFGDQPPWHPMSMSMHAFQSKGKIKPGLGIGI